MQYQFILQEVQSNRSTVPYFAAVGIVVASFGPFGMCSWGHGILSQPFVEGRNGTAICRGIGGVYKLCVVTVGKAGPCGMCYGIAISHLATSVYRTEGNKPK